ncbi:MAG: nucleotide-binding domain containing protein, partial [Pseudomonadota bacterium]
AGGESSGAVAKALGVTRLDIGAEIAPGVPWTFSHSAGEPIALALKSGNFGGPGFFAEALKKLEAA